MFIGHQAAAFAAKPLAPRVSLGTLLAATMALDLIWPVLCLTGIEHFRIDPANNGFMRLVFDHYPYSHSLIAVVGWSALAAGAHWIARKSGRDAAIVGLAVLSHWVLDFITHRPDLPLWPGGPKVGLGLWRSVPATMVVELALFGVGIWLYLRTTRSRDRTGTIALWALVGFLLAVYFASVFSPPPPSERAVAYSALAIWLFVPWGAWIDRHRQVRG